MAIYPSYFKLQMCWLLSFTQITYLSKLIGIHSIVAFLQLELLGYGMVKLKLAVNQTTRFHCLHLRE